MDESSAIDRAETAKKQREIKKFGKKVQQQVLEKRQQEKSAMMGKKKTVSDQRQGVCSLQCDKNRLTHRIHD